MPSKARIRKPPNRQLEIDTNIEANDHNAQQVVIMITVPRWPVPMSASGLERLFPVGSILVRFALASRRVRRARRYSGQGHERSSALRQRTSAAPPGQTSAYLCIPLLSLLMPCAYARTIERRREVFILAATPKGRTSSSQLLSPEARLTIAIVVLQRAPVAFRNL